MSFLTVMPYGDQLLPTVTEPLFTAMLCFEDAIQPGVEAAIESLKTGSWRRDGQRLGAKEVVMLTGETQDGADHLDPRER